jgi:hypothetical protein
MENLEKSYGRTMDANLSDGKSVHGLCTGISKEMVGYELHTEIIDQ